MAEDPPNSGEAIAPSDRVPLDELVAQPTPPEPPAPPPTKPRRPTSHEDKRAKAATDKLQAQSDRLKLENKKRKEQIARDKEDHRLIWLFRRCLAVIGVVIVVIWQFAIFVLAVLQGIGLFHLSDPVLIALVTTTTANVIGLLVIVMKFVFAPLPPPKQRTKTAK